MPLRSLTPQRSICMFDFMISFVFENTQVAEALQEDFTFGVTENWAIGSLGQALTSPQQTPGIPAGMEQKCRNRSVLSAQSFAVNSCYKISCSSKFH